MSNDVGLTVSKATTVGSAALGLASSVDWVAVVSILGVVVSVTITFIFYARKDRRARELHILKKKNEELRLQRESKELEALLREQASKGNA